MTCVDLLIKNFITDGLAPVNCTVYFYHVLITCRNEAHTCVGHTCVTDSESALYNCPSTRSGRSGVITRSAGALVFPAAAAVTNRLSRLLLLFAPGVRSLAYLRVSPRKKVRLAARCAEEPRSGKHDKRLCLGECRCRLSHISEQRT